MNIKEEFFVDDSTYKLKEECYSDYKIETVDVKVENNNNKDNAIVSSTPLASIKTEEVNIKCDSEETVKYETSPLRNICVSDDGKDCVKIDGNDTKNNDRTNLNGTCDSVHKGIYAQKSKTSAQAQLYSCKVCAYITKWKTSFNTHQLVHKHPSEIEMHKCTTCSFETKYKCDLKNHRLTHLDESEKQFFKCELCNYRSDSKYKLKRHSKVHNRIVQTATYTCEVCNMVMKRKGSLIRHMLIHKERNEIDDCIAESKPNLEQFPSEDNIYKCDVCEFQTRWKYLIQDHRTAYKHLPQINSFTCELCNIEIKRRTDIKKHMLLVHGSCVDVSMQKCTICDYETYRTWNLEQHMAGHEGTSRNKIRII